MGGSTLVKFLLDEENIKHIFANLKDVNIYKYILIKVLIVLNLI